MLKELLSQRKEMLTQLVKVNSQLLSMLDSGVDNIDELGSLIDQRTELADSLAEVEDEIETACVDGSSVPVDSSDIIKKELQDSNELMESFMVSEKDVRNQLEAFFSTKRDEVKSGRNSSRVAMNYYKVQSNAAYSDVSFLDSKK